MDKTQQENIDIDQKLAEVFSLYFSSPVSLPADYEAMVFELIRLGWIVGYKDGMQKSHDIIEDIRS